VWTGPNNFSSDVLNPVIPNATSVINGKYTLVVISGACRSLPRSIDINITDIPAKPIITSDLSYCQGDDIILSTQTVNNATNYLWNTPQGQRFTDVPELIITSVEEAAAGAYSVSIQAGNCRSQVSNPLNISVDNLVFDPIISANGPLCPGDTLKLEATFLAGVDYIWQGPNGFTSMEQNPVIPNVDEGFNGNYKVLVTMGSCSKESNELNVQVISQLSTPLIITNNQSFCSNSLPEQIEICLNQSSQVNGADYVLYNGSNDMEISRSMDLCQNIMGLADLPPGDNAFYFRIDLEGCLSSASEMIVVTIADPPIVDAEIEQSDLVFCDNETIILTSSYGPPEVAIDWTPISNNVNIQITGERTVEISNLIGGNNEVLLTYSTDLCPDFSSNTIVLLKEQASIIRNDNYRLTDFNTVLLNIFANDDLSDDNTIEIVQQPATGSLTLDDMGVRYTPDIRFSGTTSFSYEVCDVNCGGDCQQGTVILDIGDAGDCTSPTIITPNGDGYNDFFVVPCLTSGNFTGNKLTVFNQWGVVIIEQDNYQNDWAGTYNGNDLPVGTYFYVLDLGDGSDLIVGFLTLER
jgi:gliding motility-associated-like protein